MKFNPERLIDLRQSLGINKAEAARRLHMSAMGYGRYESGDREPSYQTVSFIAQTFHSSVDYLYGMSDSREPIAPTNDYPYKVGYGLCKEDDTIDDIPVAGFWNEKDAANFIKASTYDPLSSPPGRIYYMDRPVQDGPEMIQVRYIFNRETNDFVEGKEAKGIKLPGYVVHAITTEYDELGESYYDDEKTICFSYQQAERARERYLKEIGNGVVDIEIEDDVDINILEYFWGAEKFFSGDFQNKVPLSEKINELRNTPFEEGETVAQRIGMVLEDVSNEEIIQYFEDHVSGGPGLIRNYLEDQIINNEIARMRESAWMQLEKEPQDNKLAEEDTSLVRTPAETLPEEWEWESFNDGSGGLIYKGKTYFQYDRSTNEYKFEGETWKYSDKSLSELKQMAENIIRGNLIRQNIREMSPEEKGAFIFGIDMSADYGFEISNYDMQLYHAILNEQRQPVKQDYEMER